MKILALKIQVKFVQHGPKYNELITQIEYLTVHDTKSLKSNDFKSFTDWKTYKNLDWKKSNLFYMLYNMQLARTSLLSDSMSVMRIIFNETETEFE